MWVWQEPRGEGTGAGCLLDLLFNPEDGGSIFFQNASKLVPDCDLNTYHCENLKSEILLLD
jgi:hypothetical protein